MFEKIFEQIKKYNTITIFGHINPDGDCYGSQIALKQSILLSFPDKKVFALGSGLPNLFDFIGSTDKVDDSIIENSLAIILDGNDQSRCEDQRVNLAKAFVKLDHHIDYHSFKNGEFVVLTECNSTSEIVLRMLIECKLLIDSKVANALYLGILSDTAKFQFVNDFESCFNEMSFLVKSGADPKKIISLTNKINETDLKVKGYILSHYRKTKNNVIYYCLNKHIIKRLNTSVSCFSNYINIVSNVENCPIWASFCEYSDGRIRIEVRSNGPSIFEVCKSVGGGGHRNASGATLQKKDKKLIKKILLELDKIAYTYKNNGE